MASIFSDPIFVGLVVLLLGFFLFMYLFVRRIVTGFQEGLREGSK